MSTETEPRRTCAYCTHGHSAVPIGPEHEGLNVGELRAMLIDASDDAMVTIVAGGKRDKRYVLDGGVVSRRGDDGSTTVELWGSP